VQAACCSQGQGTWGRVCRNTYSRSAKHDQIILENKETKLTKELAKTQSQSVIDWTKSGSRKRRGTTELNKMSEYRWWWLSLYIVLCADCPMGQGFCYCFTPTDTEAY
jgi:hypothetical protein